MKKKNKFKNIVIDSCIALLSFINFTLSIALAILEIQQILMLYCRFCLVQNVLSCPLKLIL